MGSVIRELIERQVALLREQLNAREIDPVLLAEQAETLWHYAQCLRDFPDLVASLGTSHPVPPPFLEGILPREMPREGAPEAVCDVPLESDRASDPFPAD